MAKTQHRIPVQRDMLTQILCVKIKNFRNDLAPKLDDMIRMWFENTNGLPTSKSGYYFNKVNKLRNLWSKLNKDFSSLVETQINPSLLFNKDIRHATMFKNQSDTSALSKNKNELIGKRQ